MFFAREFLEFNIVSKIYFVSPRTYCYTDANLRCDDAPAPCCTCHVRTLMRPHLVAMS